MTFFFRSTSLLMLLVVWVASSLVFAQQKASDINRSQEDISMDLVSSDRAVMASAYEDYLNIPVDQRTSRIQIALVDALAIENERRRKYYLGEGPHWALGPDDAIGLGLFREVMRMRDPAYINVLLPWLCCGNSPAWIELGRDAIQPVLQFVYDNEPGYEESMFGGVSVLQKMVDHWQLDSFNSDQKKQLKEIALRYILPNDLSNPWFLFLPAVRLSSAIEDIELIQMAENIVNDEDELRKRPHTDEWRVEYLRKTVSEAVLGTREPYRHVSYERDLQENDILDPSR